METFFLQQNSVSSSENVEYRKMKMKLIHNSKFNFVFESASNPERIEGKAFQLIKFPGKIKLTKFIFIEHL